jgi:hypothetical protein
MVGVMCPGGQWSPRVPPPVLLVGGGPVEMTFAFLIAVDIFVVKSGHPAYSGADQPVLRVATGESGRRAEARATLSVLEGCRSASGV